MNSAVLQGTIMATTHGIQRLRYNRETRNGLRKTERLETYLSRQHLKAHSDESSRSKDEQLAFNGRLDYNSKLLSDPSSHGFIPLVDETPRGALVVDGLNGEDQLLRLNIGGQSFVFRTQTLIRVNEGFLSAFAKHPHDLRLLNADGYFEATREYYFERPSIHFPIVYQFYTAGKLHQSMHLCPIDLLSELSFWHVDFNKLNGLCSCTHGHALENESEFNSILGDETDESGEFENVRFGRLRRKIWLFIEQPSSSVHAKIFAAVSVLFVVASISGLVLGSLPSLQTENQDCACLDKTSQLVELEPHPYLSRLEWICIVWFAFEYFTKILITTRHWKTFTRLLNLIDLIAILPFMLETLLLILDINAEQLQDLKGAFLGIRILRILRVVRILKLGRYSSGLQMFCRTIHASYRQLGMLAMVVLTGVILFASLLYFVEKDEPDTEFVSIPSACWFAVVTMTTVGYGDMTPKSTIGKLIATVAIACGVLVLALPITIVVDAFMKVAEAERRPEISDRGSNPKVNENENLRT